MSTVAFDGLLRPGLLEDVSLLIAGAAAPQVESTLGPVVASSCAALGAQVSSCESDTVEEAGLDAAVVAAVGEMGQIDLLAVDGAALFAEGLARGGDGHAALRMCMDATWNATRAVINHAFLAGVEPGGESSATSAAVADGRVVYLAPAPDAGEYAAAACASLENLARTLSTEWARHGVTVVTVAPGTSTAASEVAALIAYLASPAGAYFSGCQLDLRGV
jgi:NAD(P)-dependent dehydrogenase (short-subunit alcohol dehydrogenase family)